MTMTMKGTAIYAEPVPDEIRLGLGSLAGVGGMQPPSTVFTIDERFDVGDVQKAFALLNPFRKNPRFDHIAGIPGACSYVERDASGAALALPSCLVGTLIFLLDPDYFAGIKSEGLRVATLPRVYDVFTRRAVDLLLQAQRNADGYLGMEQQTWGDAFVNALADLT